MNSITIKSKIVTDYRIEYEYTIMGEWKKYFTNETFYAEYSRPIKDINNSIAIIPVLGTVLPISWVFDAEIIVDEIDEMFYNSIPEFKKGYINMFPQLNFRGRLVADKIIKNENSGSKSAALFSGGVDAFATLFTQIGKNPDLITIWGADIAAENDDGWNVVKNHRDKVLDLLRLAGITIKSSFRKSINEIELSAYSLKNANDNWWHGFHHGIGMFALTAPIAYINGYSELYVASSFTAEYKGQYTAASDPTIDNYVKFCGCNVVHDGYEFNRQDKIHNICKYSNEHNIKIPLRVCWESTGGSNCCRCEKCCRTMLGIYAEGHNPVNFGFNFWNDSLSLLRKTLSKSSSFGDMRYGGIQKRMRDNYSKKEIIPSLRWFYTTDVNVLAIRFKIRKKIKNIIIKILKKAKVI